MDNPFSLPVRGLAEAIRSRQTTSKHLTRLFLDQIEAVNPALNAVVRFEPEIAMKYAEQADLALDKGEMPGKLSGIPMTIKDSLDTFDMITTWGTEGRREFRPSKDAACVQRLRNEGAILMGKTNTPEFTLSFKTDNLIFGQTNNPFDTSKTSGGSSGGAAAIISAEGSPFDVGTDTGGSIRLPSHFCGVAGIKPTTGRIPCTGNALPTSGVLSPLTQPGPMAKSVDDLIYLLEVMAGPDNVDQNAIPCPLLNPYDIQVSKLKIGYHTDNGIKTPDKAIVSAVNFAVDILAEEKIFASEVRPSGIEMAALIFSHLMAADSTYMIETLLEESCTSAPSPITKELLAGLGTTMNGAEYSQTINVWHNFKSSMLGYFDKFDVLISPVNAHTAAPHAEKEDFAAYSYTTAFNLTGWPSVVIRAGTDLEGLPIGIQILAAPFREDHCLAVASWLESRLPFRP